MRRLTDAEVERWHENVERARVEAFKRELRNEPKPKPQLSTYRKFILDLKAKAHA